MRKKKLWLLALPVLAVIAVCIYLASDRKPPETKYQLYYSVASRHVEEDTGRFFASAYPIDLETQEISTIEYVLGTHDLFLYTSSGGRISTDEIQPGDILVVHTDDTTEHAIYPVTLSAPYYLTLLDTPLDASGQAESSA